MKKFWSSVMGRNSSSSSTNSSIPNPNNTHGSTKTRATTGFPNLQNNKKKENKADSPVPPPHRSWLGKSLTHSIPWIRIVSIEKELQAEIDSLQFQLYCYLRAPYSLLVDDSDSLPVSKRQDKKRQEIQKAVSFSSQQSTVPDSQSQSHSMSHSSSGPPSPAYSGMHGKALASPSYQHPVGARKRSFSINDSDPAYASDIATVANTGINSTTISPQEHDIDILLELAMFSPEDLPDDNINRAIPIPSSLDQVQSRRGGNKEDDVMMLEIPLDEGDICTGKRTNAYELFIDQPLLYTILDTILTLPTRYSLQDCTSIFSHIFWYYLITEIDDSNITGSASHSNVTRNIDTIPVIAEIVVLYRVVILFHHLLTGTEPGYEALTPQSVSLPYSPCSVPRRMKIPSTVISTMFYFINKQSLIEVIEERIVYYYRQYGTPVVHRESESGRNPLWSERETEGVVMTIYDEILCTVCECVTVWEDMITIANDELMYSNIVTLSERLRYRYNIHWMRQREIQRERQSVRESDTNTDNSNSNSNTVSVCHTHSNSNTSRSRSHSLSSTGYKFITPLSPLVEETVLDLLSPTNNRIDSDDSNERDSDIWVVRDREIQTTCWSKDPWDTDEIVQQKHHQIVPSGVILSLYPDNMETMSRVLLPSPSSRDMREMVMDMDREGVSNVSCNNTTWLVEEVQSMLQREREREVIGAVSMNEIVEEGEGIGESESVEEVHDESKSSSARDYEALVEEQEVDISNINVNTTSNAIMDAHTMDAPTDSLPHCESSSESYSGSIHRYLSLSTSMSSISSEEGIDSVRLRHVDIDRDRDRDRDNNEEEEEGEERESSSGDVGRRWREREKEIQRQKEERERRGRNSRNSSNVVATDHNVDIKFFGGQRVVVRKK